jgi:hypothetical protein
MEDGLAPLASDGTPVRLRPNPRGGPGALAESKGTFQKDFGALRGVSPKTTAPAGDRKKHAAWKRGYWKQRAASLAPPGGAP